MTFTGIFLLAVSAASAVASLVLHAACTSSSQGTWASAPVGTCLRWSSSQLVTSLVTSPSLGGLFGVGDWAEGWEERSWAEWESLIVNEKRGDDDGVGGGRSEPLAVPSLDLSDVPALVRRCRSIDPSLAGAKTAENADDDGDGDDDLNAAALTALCVSRLLSDPAWRSRPLLLKSLWNASALASPTRTLSPRGLATDPELSRLEVPYYSDASKSGYAALKPSGRAALGDILRNITDDQGGGRQKVGSQLIIETDPVLIDEVAPAELIRELFGDRFKPDDVRGSGPWGVFPATTTVPVFLGGVDVPLEEERGFDEDGKCRCRETETEKAHPAEDKGCRADDDDGGGGETCSEAKSPTGGTPPPLSPPESTASPPRPRRHARTDLHSEPIASLSVQLSSSKSWTLVDPSETFALRPAVSERGRAFFYSTLDPLAEEDAARLERVERRYRVTTKAGDGLWVPPWWWHRVDYRADDDGGGCRCPPDRRTERDARGDSSSTTQGTTAATAGSMQFRKTRREVSLAASLFHFRPAEFVTHHPLFAVLIVPNLIKELMGRKVE